MFCAICQTTIGQAEAVSSCPECQAVYHGECHEENGGCGTYGCSRVPRAPAQADPVISPAIWGRDRKDCPYCRTQIRAAALRCRHCGATFDTYDPLTPEQFQEMAVRRSRIARLKSRAIGSFVCGVVPILAPIGLFANPMLLPRHRAMMSMMPALHRMLAWLGLGLSGLWVLVLAAVVILS